MGYCHPLCGWNELLRGIQREISGVGMESLHQQKAVTKEILAGRLGGLGLRQIIVAVKSPTSFSLPSGSATGSFNGFHPRSKF